MTRILAAAAVALIAVRGTADAQVRQGCGPRAKVEEQLATKYDEVPIHIALQSNGNLLVVYVNDERQTWTIVSTTPAGRSCVVAAGKRWETIEALKGAAA